MVTFPGQVTSNVVGSRWHPKTEQEMAMERMRLQHGWDVEAESRAESRQRAVAQQQRDWERQFAQQQRGWGREDFMNRQNDILAMQERERKKGEARMRQAFSVLQRPSMQNAWDRARGEVVGPRPPGIPADYMGRYIQKAPGAATAPNAMEWVPRTPIPEQMYQKINQRDYDLGRAMAIWGAGMR